MADHHHERYLRRVAQRRQCVHAVAQAAVLHEQRPALARHERAGQHPHALLLPRHRHDTAGFVRPEVIEHPAHDVVRHGREGVNAVAPKRVGHVQVPFAGGHVAMLGDASHRASTAYCAAKASLRLSLEAESVTGKIGGAVHNVRGSLDWIEASVSKVRRSFVRRIVLSLAWGVPPGFPL